MGLSGRKLRSWSYPFEGGLGILALPLSVPPLHLWPSLYLCTSPVSPPISTHRWCAASQVADRGLGNNEPKQTYLPLSCLSHIFITVTQLTHLVSTQRIFKANSSAPFEITRGWEVPDMPWSLCLCCESMTQVTGLLAFQLCIFTEVMSACLISYWWKGVDICNMAAFF